MTRIAGLVMALAFLVAVSVPPAAAADTKWVRGTVSAVAGDSVTVKVNEKEMTFKIDAATDIVAPGGGTATRQAQAAGKAGVELGKLVKAGDRVEVHYQEAAGVMKAVELRTNVRAEPGTSEDKPAGSEGKSARGTVTAVAADSLTVKGDAGEWTFMVDAKTRVIGTGLGTMSRDMATKGAAPTLGDAVKAKDTVVVSFHDMGGKLHATEVRVVRKGT